ncbi:MAG: arsenical-resistance protein, partial [Nitrospirota bacterium]
MANTMNSALPSSSSSEKRLNIFERYLTVWVGLCIVAGILVGQVFPSLVSTFRSWELGEGSHINLPIAVLIWLMIIPMMMKVDLTALRNVGRRP